MKLIIQFYDIETANKYKETFEKFEIDNTIECKKITIYNVTKFENFKENNHIWFEVNNQILFIDNDLIRDIYMYI